MDSPLKYFADLRDPRVERTREHLLEEILLIAIAAILSGANGWNEIEDYARCKREWLNGFLKLPGGIPSHDTFNRVFSGLDREEFGKGLRCLGVFDCQADGGRSRRHRRQGAAGHLGAREKGHRAYGFGLGEP